MSDLDRPTAISAKIPVPVVAIQTDPKHVPYTSHAGPPRLGDETATGTVAADDRE